MSRSKTIIATRKRIRELYSVAGYGRFYAWVREQLCPFFRIEEFIPKTGQIIDIGCGYGLMANILTLMGPERQVMGIDKAEYRINKAKLTAADHQRSSFICQDIRTVSLKNCQGITMVDFLHHIPFTLQEEILAKIPELLGESGVLVIKEFADKPRWKYWATLLFEAVFYPKDLLTYRPIAEWQKMLENLGFVVTTTTAGEGSFVPSVILVARKRN